MKKELLNKFLKYISIDTQSDDTSETYPSTQKQFNLAKLLVEELTQLGLKDISVDEHCYVMATLPANNGKSKPVIGLIAHMDTAPDMSGANVNPQIIESYDGKDIVLDKEKRNVQRIDCKTETGMLIKTLLFKDIKDFGNGVIRPSVIETQSDLYKGYKSVMIFAKIKPREFKDEFFTLAFMSKIESLR